jgi:rhamnosyltransferase
MVTYHPDAELPARIARVSSQVSRTFIVDNGSGEDAAAMLARLGADPAVQLIENHANLGIARALNVGLQAALGQATEPGWALLLDQDTEVDPDIVRHLLEVAASYPEPAKLALVGARYRDTHGRAPDALRLTTQGETWQAVSSVITSGSLLSLESFAALGPFREEFFIDYVDVDYCHRARAAGYQVIETRAPLMSHTVGAPTAHRLLGKTQWTTNHSAERRYYIARNNTVLLREYGTSQSRRWRYKSFVRCVRLCKRIIFFETNKTAKIVAVAQGWWDALRGRMGPRPH